MGSIITEADAKSYRDQFPIFDNKVYLNSCSLGPMNRASRAALEQYADDWTEFGAPAWWLRWIPRVTEIRTLFAQAIEAELDEVTIHHSVSSALSSIASAIDYRERNKVVVSEIDFPTISYQWLVKQGVEVAFARSPDGITIPIEEYERLIDDRTAAVATSHVFYATGAVQDVKAIASIAHQRGALAIIDGYHAVGVLPVSVHDIGADFYVGGTLKWVCGGPGLTFIYASPEMNATRMASVTGWFASADQFAFDTLQFNPAGTAERFQLGTPAIPTVYTGVPALSLILEAGPAAIYERIQMLTQRVVDAAHEQGLDLASPEDANVRGGIVMLRTLEGEKIVETLTNQSIIIDARPGKIRISPHFYNTIDDVDAVMSALKGVPQAIPA